MDLEKQERNRVNAEQKMRFFSAALTWSLEASSGAAAVGCVRSGVVLAFLASPDPLPLAPPPQRERQGEFSCCFFPELIYCRFYRQQGLRGSGRTRSPRNPIRWRGGFCFLSKDEMHVIFVSLIIIIYSIILCFNLSGRLNFEGIGPSDAL
jgi:hypothetical protein